MAETINIIWDPEIERRMKRDARETLEKYFTEKRYGELTFHFQSGILTHITEKHSRKPKTNVAE